MVSIPAAQAAQRGTNIGQKSYQPVSGGKELSGLIKEERAVDSFSGGDSQVKERHIHFPWLMGQCYVDTNHTDVSFWPQGQKPGMCLGELS